jgi:serine/threonine-protein kinase
MGEVQLAKMTSGAGSEWVALKRLRAELVEQPDWLGQFEREARICALLHHENIVSLKTFGRDGGGPYLALEYVDGVSAGRLVKANANSPLPVEAALCIGFDTARALAYAHSFASATVSGGVVHRDVTPGNILVSRSGVAKLADFGIARLTGTTRLTTTGAVRGTLGFIAPEIFENHEANPTTDVFALGATLYFILCGVPPFSANSDAALIRAVLSTVPQRPSALRNGVDPGLESWVMRSLSKTGTERPRLDELIELAQSRSGSALQIGRETLARQVAQVAQAPPPVAPGLVPVSPSSTRSVETAPSRVGRRVALSAGGALCLAAIAWAVLGALRPAAAVTSAQDPAPASQPESVAAAEPQPDPPASALASGDSTSRPGPSRPSTERAQGTIEFRVRPWAQVFLDGALLGPTPLAPVTASPGKHAVVLVNEKLDVRKTYIVQVRPGRATALKVYLDEP